MGDKEKDEAQLVTVYSTSDPLSLELARSILEEAGIACVSKGGGMEVLFGYGTLGSLYSPDAGSLRLEVWHEDEADARQLLEGLGKEQ